MEDLADMMFDPNDMLFDSNASPRPLNTPPSFINVEDFVEHDLNNPSISSNENVLFHKINALVTSVGELIKETSEIKETFHGLERSNKSIVEMLQQLIQSNALINKNIPQFVQANTPSFRFSTDETSMRSSNQTVTENNQEARTRNSTAAGENLSHNDFNSNGQLSVASDKIRSKKNQGKFQIAQRCREIIPGPAAEPPSLTDPVASIIAADSAVIREKQPCHKKKSTQHRSSILNYRLSRHLTTTNENLGAVCKSGSIELSLLHPLKEQLNPKTDRCTDLMDYLSRPPTLIVCGDGLPDHTSMEIAMISRSSKGDYYSIHRFAEDTDFICREIKTYGDCPRKIELKDLRIGKKPNYQMKDNKTFKLKCYPSDKEEDTKLNRPKALTDQYNLKEAQLAIRIFQSETREDPFIFYSNPLSELYDKQPASRPLNIISIRPSGKIISFDCKSRCQMEFSTKLPEILHCTLSSGYKWFEISIISGDHLSSIYYIDSGDGKKKNPYYFNIKNPSFNISFEIVKQICSNFDEILNDNINEILSTTVHSHFHIQIRLLHSEGLPDQSCKIDDYLDHKPWESAEFHEDMGSSINSEQQNLDIGFRVQKRSNEECDYSAGLPITKAPRILPNNEEWL